MRMSQKCVKQKNKAQKSQERQCSWLSFYSRFPLYIPCAQQLISSISKESWLRYNFFDKTMSILIKYLFGYAVSSAMFYS